MELSAATVVAMSVVLIATSCGQTSAVKCYSCGAGDSCKDPFSADKVNTTDCPTTSVVTAACSKTKAGDIVTRTCGYLPPGTSAGCSSAGGTTSCLCTGDNCNGATMATLGHVVVGLSLSSVVAVVYIFGRQ
jgi:hypothetical protein